MNADKNGASIRIGDGDARPERNENIAAPRHHDAIPGGLQDGAQPLCDIQRHYAFGNALSGNPSAVIATVARINDNGSHDGGSKWSCRHGEEEQTSED